MNRFFMVWLLLTVACGGPALESEQIFQGEPAPKDASDGAGGSGSTSSADTGSSTDGTRQPRAGDVPIGGTLDGGSGGSSSGGTGGTPQASTGGSVGSGGSVEPGTGGTGGSGGSGSSTSAGGPGGTGGTSVSHDCSDHTECGAGSLCVTDACTEVDLSGIYKPLVARAESYIRSTRHIAAHEAIRLALVCSEQLSTLCGQIEGIIQFNGMPAQTNGKNFLRVDTSAFGAMDPEMNVDALIKHQPHLVISINGAEFTTEDVLGVLEISLSEQAPFYILSPYALGLQSTLDLVASYESSQVSRRLLGVSTNEERVASVYCLAPDPQSASGALLFFEDVLTYDSESSSLAGGDPCNMVGFIGN